MPLIPNIIKSKMRMRRKKIKIKKIDDIEARQVAFSKRRHELVKKARELSILCQAEVAVTITAPAAAGRLHQYSSSNIKDTFNKFSLYLEAEQHQEEKRNNARLGSGVEDKINCLRLITSQRLQNFSPEELHSLETKLEARLQYVTAKKKELLTNEVLSPLQTKNTRATGTIRTQSEKVANKAAGGMPEANNEGASFQITENNADSQAETRVPPLPDVYKVNSVYLN